MNTREHMNTEAENNQNMPPEDDIRRIEAEMMFIAIKCEDVQMTMRMPKGKAEVTEISDSMGFGSLLQIYMMSDAIPKIIRRARDEKEVTDAEGLLHEVLQVIEENTIRLLNVEEKGEEE